MFRIQIENIKLYLHYNPFHRTLQQNELTQMLREFFCIDFFDTLEHLQLTKLPQQCILGVMLGFSLCYFVLCRKPKTLTVPEINQNNCRTDTNATCLLYLMNCGSNSMYWLLWIHLAICSVKKYLAVKVPSWHYQQLG